MAKMKKVLAIAMAAAMGMSMLAGCGGQKKGDADVVSSAEKTEAEQTEATEEDHHGGNHRGDGGEQSGGRRRCADRPEL